MSDVGQNEEPLTVADLNAFFAEKITSGLACPLCRTRNFRTHDESPYAFANLYIASVSSTNLPPVLTGTSIRSVAIFCLNCGYSLLFNRAVIVNWKRNRK
jgi:predicted nucleic-acid-binding Zn-ribbon protein